MSSSNLVFINVILPDRTRVGHLVAVFACQRLGISQPVDCVDVIENRMVDPERFGRYVAARLPRF